MSDTKEKKAGTPAPAPKAPREASGGGPKGAVAPDNCKFEECKKKTEKFGFCMEHYDLYMEGVIRGDGKKPIDYAQKLVQFLKTQVNKRAA